MPRSILPSLKLGLAASMAARGLVRAPGSSALAVVILALGLALPATFFSFLVGAIRPLPVPEGDRVVRIDVVQPERGGGSLPFLAGDLAALRGSASLQGLEGFRPFGGTVVDRERAAARVSGAAVTPGTFALLRVGAQLGRIPLPTEASATVLLGHDLWQELYGGDPSALGRTVEVDGVLRTVVGVLPEGFGFPFKQNAWILVEPATDPGEPLELWGRLAEGATLEGAGAELAARWTAGDAARAPDRTGGRLSVKPYTGSRGEGGEVVAFAGLVLVALCLLLIACANVANLLLVRATERVRALGIQSALGAGRLQIGAQLFLESLMLAAAGGTLGLLAADATVSAAQRGLAAEHFGYFWMRMAVDGTVLAFVGLLVVGTALVAGVLPVVRVLRADVRAVLAEEGSGSSAVRGGAWSHAFVTAQLALSCGALVAAGLTGRALAGSRHFGGTLPVDEVLLASMAPPTGDDGRILPGVEASLEEALAALPGSRGAALALGAPAYRASFTRLEVQGSETAGPEAREGTGWNAVTPGYFDVVGLPLRAGRGIGPGDDAAGARVAVVSESFVRRFSPEEAVLGRRLRLAADSAAWFTVVGVVADADLGLGEEARYDMVFVPLAQVHAAEVLALVRGVGDGARLAPELRRAVAGVDPAIALWGVRTLADAHAYMVRVPRALAGMAVAGGSAGLLVAMVGLYGLLAFRVRQRRRELGIRLALGADGAMLARSVLALAVRQLLPAVAVGLALAWTVSPILSAVLLGLDPRSGSTYLTVAGVFVGTGMLASLVPALRAARVDPARVLRGD